MTTGPAPAAGSDELTASTDPTEPAGDDRPEPVATVLTRGTVVVDVDACKGCDLCIDACPPRVLVMTSGDQVNSRGYRYPLLLPGCTGCKACSQICPDFVFQVYKYETPRQIPLRVDPPTPGDDVAGETEAAAR